MTAPGSRPLPLIPCYRTDTVRRMTHQEVLIENDHARARLSRDKGYADPQPTPSRRSGKSVGALTAKIAAVMRNGSDADE